MKNLAESIYVIIPAFNEQKHIREVVLKSYKFCKNIIVVDDGSSDSTGTIAKKLPVTQITLPINRGKGNALKVGIEYAIKKGAAFIVTLDADGQHNPSHIPKFISALQENDIAIGIRKGHDAIPIIRKIGNRIACIIIAAFYGIYVEDLLCGFRSFRSSVYPNIKWTSSGYGIETEMIAKIGVSKLKYKEIIIENIYLDQFKGVSLLDAIEVFFSIPSFKIKKS